MPWCDDCGKFWNPNSMAPDGSCPRCGEVIASAGETEVDVPWHFWVLVTAAGLYLLWRVVEGVAWVVGA